MEKSNYFIHFLMNKSNIRVILYSPPVFSTKKIPDFFRGCVLLQRLVFSQKILHCFPNGKLQKSFHRNFRDHLHLLCAIFKCFPLTMYKAILLNIYSICIMELLNFRGFNTARGDEFHVLSLALLYNFYNLFH